MAMRPTPHPALLHQRLGELFQKEGIALRFGEEHLRQGRRDGLRLQHCSEELHAIRGREWRHGELSRIGLLDPGGPISRAVGAQEQERGAREALHQRGEKLRRGGIAPVQVFHGENQRVLLTALEHQLPQRLKGFHLQRLRARARQLLSSHLYPEQVQQIRGSGVRLHPYRLQPPTHLLDESVDAICRRDPAVRPQQVEHGQVGRGTAVGQTLPHIIGSLVFWNTVAEFDQGP
jgi:hypothetical protein